MADRDSDELRQLLVAENAYATDRTEHLRPLAEQVFEEFRSRIEETDLSVPVRHDRWWYTRAPSRGSSTPWRRGCWSLLTRAPGPRRRTSARG